MADEANEKAIDLTAEENIGRNITKPSRTQRKG